MSLHLMIGRIPSSPHRVAHSLGGAAARALVLATLLVAHPAHARQATDPPGGLSTPGARLDPRELARSVDAVLAAAGRSRGEWGVSIRDAATGEPLYGRAADRPLIPASNLKLVVAATAARRLGPGYRHRTSLYSDGPVRDGVLHGDLVLYGRGDPTLSARYDSTPTAVLEALADSLRTRGIRRIAGGIVADESHFDSAKVRPEWREHDLLWWYAAPVGALGVNDNALDIRVAPGRRPGAPAMLEVRPRGRFHRVENRVTTTRRGSAPALRFERIGSGNHIRVSGGIPAGGGTVTEHVSLADPAGATGALFLEVLERKGIAVGRAAVRVVSHAERSIAGARIPLVDHSSRELSWTIGPILGSSQNWFAELLVKTLGRELRGEGSWAAGLEIEQAYLTGVVGLDSASFRLRDGSGLSVQNRISADALARLLVHLHSAPEGALVRDALPVSGVSGSLKRRLEDLSGRVVAKTGYISESDALSGYLIRRDGRVLAFSILSNGRTLPPARRKAGIDAVVRAMDAAALPPAPLGIAVPAGAR